MKADELPAPVLIVDDSEDDVVIFTRNLRVAGLKNPVLQFRNGGDVFMFLKQFCEPGKARGLVPAVMFLDVNMQGLSGFDVLAWARQQAPLEGMKIFMLSGANETWDAQIATKLGADSYLEKFPKPDALKQILSSARLPLRTGAETERKPPQFLA